MSSLNEVCPETFERRRAPLDSASTEDIGRRFVLGAVFDRSIGVAVGRLNACVYKPWRRYILVSSLASTGSSFLRADLDGMVDAFQA